VKLFGLRIKAESNAMVVRSGPDGIFDPCYFCGGTVTRGSDCAALMVERIDPKGDPIHAVCRGSCAESARGELAP